MWYECLYASPRILSFSILRISTAFFANRTVRNSVQQLVQHLYSKHAHFPYLNLNFVNFWFKQCGFYWYTFVCHVWRSKFTHQNWSSYHLNCIMKSMWLKKNRTRNAQIQKNISCPNQYWRRSLQMTNELMNNFNIHFTEIITRVADIVYIGSCSKCAHRLSSLYMYNYFVCGKCYYRRNYVASPPNSSSNYRDLILIARLRMCSAFPENDFR